MRDQHVMAIEAVSGDITVMAVTKNSHKAFIKDNVGNLTAFCLKQHSPNKLGIVGKKDSCNSACIFGNIIIMASGKELMMYDVKINKTIKSFKTTSDIVNILYFKKETFVVIALRKCSLMILDLKTLELTDVDLHKNITNGKHINGLAVL